MRTCDEIPVVAAARRLRLSERQVYRLIEAGKLRVRRYSARKTFVLVESIRQYLEAHLA